MEFELGVPKINSYRMSADMPKNAHLNSIAQARMTDVGVWETADRRDWRDRAVFAAKSDEMARRAEFVVPMPAFVRLKWLLIGLRDERDMPVAVALVGMLMLVLPGAAWLYLLESPSHAQGLLYFLFIQGLFLQRYLVALLHTTEHRQLFKSDWLAMNSAPRFVLAPFFGLPLGWSYHLHHVVMHHTEDNHYPFDISSTEEFQRDNLLHFLRYWLRHVLWGMVEVPWYAIRQRRPGLALRCACTQALYIYIIWQLLGINRVATLWTFVIPFFTTSLALMFGNWSQHVFLNPAALATPYGVTYNCLKSSDNQRTFNDGYHILHHMNSRTHWSELPARFVQSLDKHADHEAIVFEGIGIFDVGVAVFSGNLGFLADHIIPCGDKMAGLSREELIGVLRDRLKPVKQQKVSQHTD